MKRYIQNLAVFTMAVVVFLTGTGATVINYCCSDCVDQTLFVSELHSCCTSMEDVVADDCDMNHIPDLLAHGDKSNEDYCSASRLSTDLDLSIYKPHVSAPFIWISDSIVVLSKLVSEDSSIADIFLKELPPGISPRSYLSLIRVLII